MAVEINKNRMLLSRILVGLVLLSGFVTAPAIHEWSALYMLLKLAGYILLAACAVGRIYSTAFIGGIKNKKLVTEGPYSTCRNPLYFYSLLGAAGIGLLSAQLISFVIIFGGFLLIYDGLIKREEKYLAGKFGKEFTEYKARVPRLWPKFSQFRTAEELPFQPRFFTYAVWDAIWWFAAFPVFELAKYLQQADIIKPLFTVF
ncbi:MAG: isoprenylcysteine carboxylmethyltransferase family protein [Alphaproteobacteria bacterium]|nr:isoprenylcysteine carboxylmethyltransferase family protein [Alphaproteobacteria bacterium]